MSIGFFGGPGKGRKLAVAYYEGGKWEGALVVSRWQSLSPIPFAFLAPPLTHPPNSFFSLPRPLPCCYPSATPWPLAFYARKPAYRSRPGTLFLARAIRPHPKSCGRQLLSTTWSRVGGKYTLPNPLIFY